VLRAKRGLRNAGRIVGADNIGEAHAATDLLGRYKGCVELGLPATEYRDGAYS
jgi:hypothetical protein